MKLEEERRQSIMKEEAKKVLFGMVLYCMVWYVTKDIEYIPRSIPVVLCSKCPTSIHTIVIIGRNRVTFTIIQCLQAIDREKIEEANREREAKRLAYLEEIKV